MLDIIITFGIYISLFHFFFGYINKHANVGCYENTQKNNEKLGEMLGRHEKLCKIKWKILGDLKHGDDATLIWRGNLTEGE